MIPGALDACMVYKSTKARVVEVAVTSFDRGPRFRIALYSSSCTADDRCQYDVWSSAPNSGSVLTGETWALVRCHRADVITLIHASVNEHLLEWKVPALGPDKSCRRYLAHSTHEVRSTE